jgi:hypothetical protein
MNPLDPRLVSTARRIGDLLEARRERRTAVQCLKYLHWDGTWKTPTYVPTEQEIARFIVLMRENPFVVPSFDPDDP